MTTKPKGTDTFAFFATFSTGQPGFPGYLRVEVRASMGGKEEAETEARRRVSEATGGKWCALYDSIDKLHPLDNVFRGEC